MLISKQMAILNKNKKTEPVEPPEVEYFREISERYLYWISRDGETCKVIADNYKKLMNALTIDE